MTRWLIALLLLVHLTGCATIVSKSSKDVAFTSTPPGAEVRIESKKPGRYYSTVTPGTVNISKKASYFAQFSMPGYHTMTYPVNRVVGKAAAGSGVGNLLLIGLLAPIGMGIDAASGAAATFPEIVHADLVPATEAPPGNVGEINEWRLKAQQEQEAKREAPGRRGPHP